MLFQETFTMGGKPKRAKAQQQKRNVQMLETLSMRSDKRLFESPLMSPEKRMTPSRAMTSSNFVSPPADSDVSLEDHNPHDDDGEYSSSYSNLAYFDSYFIL